MSKKNKLGKAEIQDLVDKANKSLDENKAERRKRFKEAREIYSDVDFKSDLWIVVKGWFGL